MAVPFAGKCSLRIPYPNALTDEHHFENYKEISRWADRFQRECLGVGGRYPATRTVAASDASDLSKETADYVCDGVEDEEEINEALAVGFNLSDAGSTAYWYFGHPGGRVLLSEGVFNISTDDGIDSGLALTGIAGGIPQSTLQGQGKYATVLNYTGTGYAIISFGEGYTVRDLAVLGTNAQAGNLGVYLQGEYSTIENVALVDLGADIGQVSLPASNGRIINCDFFGGETGTDAAGISGTGGQVINCTFEDTPKHAIYASTSGSPDNHIVIGNRLINCQWDGASTDVISVGPRSIVIGNVCIGSVATATIASGTGSQVANNILE